MGKAKDIKDRYIISLQASSIMRAMDEIVKDKDGNPIIDDDGKVRKKGSVTSKPNMFTGVFPYSLEMIALEKVAPNTFFTANGKNKLSSIINVRFDNS